MPAAPVETPSPRRSHGDGVAAIASRAHVREQRRGRDQRSMASVTSHGSARFLCVAAACSPDSPSVVVRSPAMASLPVLVQGPGVDGLAPAADGNDGRGPLARQSHGAKPAQRCMLPTVLSTSANAVAAKLLARCLHDLGDAAKNEFACSLLGLRLRSIVVPVIEGGG